MNVWKCTFAVSEVEMTRALTFLSQAPSGIYLELPKLLLNTVTPEVVGGEPELAVYSLAIVEPVIPGPPLLPFSHFQAVAFIIAFAGLIKRVLRYRCISQAIEVKPKLRSSVATLETKVNLSSKLLPYYPPAAFI